MGDRLTSTLVEASNMYQLQLVQIMLPDMLRSFQVMRAGSRNLRAFQVRLQEVVSWNQDVISEHTNRILLCSPLLDELIAAVYLATVQVLSHVRLPNSRSDIRVQVPAKTVFVHTAYKLAAQDFYELVAEGQNCFVEGRIKMQKRVIAGAVERTISRLLPLKQLLDAYIAKEVDEHGMVSPEPFAGAAAAEPLAAGGFPSPALPPFNPGPEPEREPEREAEPEPEREPEPEPEREHRDDEYHHDHDRRSEEHHRPAPNWMDDGTEEEPQPEKRVQLSPRPVMCEDAGDSGELD